jgi:hypothetical protein
VANESARKVAPVTEVTAAPPALIRVGSVGLACVVAVTSDEAADWTPAVTVVTTYE